jgi:hypothetical protein
MKRFVGIGVALLGSAAALAGPPPASRPVFKADVEAVNLAVSISDGQRFVTDLGQTDFQIYEDGVRQDLSIFSQEHTPISLAILLDCSLSMEPKIEQAREAAVRFVSKLRPQDEAQIVHFNDKVRVVQDFTSDIPQLEAAIRAAQPSGGTALYTAVYIALKDLARQRREGEVRKLSIVVLSDGEDTATSRRWRWRARARSACTGSASRGPAPPPPSAPRRRCRASSSPRSPVRREGRRTSRAPWTSSTRSTSRSSTRCARSTASGTSRPTRGTTASGGTSSSSCSAGPSCASATSPAISLHTAEERNRRWRIKPRAACW